MTDGDNLRNVVEVAGAHFVLMLGRTVSLFFGRELRLLQFRIGFHSSIAIASRELKHAVIERVETGQGNELEFVAQRPQLTLKFCDTSAIEMQDSLLVLEQERIKIYNMPTFPEERED
jgi:hypothetical protein